MSEISWGCGFALVALLSGLASGSSVQRTAAMALTYTNAILQIGHGDSVVRGQGYGDRVA